MSDPNTSNDYLKDTIQDGIPQDTNETDLQLEHPELYGRLLMANEKLENVGTMVIWMMFAFVLAVCVSIHMAWVDPVLGIPVERLQGWGVYALIAVVSFVLYSIYNEVRERMTYRSLRPEIVNYLNRNNLSIPWLVAQIEEDSTVEEIANHLKSDSG